MSLETKENKTDTPVPAPSPTTTTTTTASSSTLNTDNVWSSLLKKALRKNKENNSTLVMMGVPKSGKSSLLSKFSDRIVNDQQNEYLLQYSYLLVKNKYAQDKDDVLAHMNIWQFDDIQQLSILPLLLTGISSSSVADIASSLTNQPNSNKPDTLQPSLSPTLQSSPSHAHPSSSPTLSSSSTSHPTLHNEQLLNNSVISQTDAAATLDNTIYVVVVDLSSPATILSELTSWLQSISNVTERMMNSLTTEQQQNFKTKISRHVQTYYANLSNTTTASTGISITSTDPITPSVPIQPDIPSINIGIPVLIVGTKADTFTRKGAKPTTPVVTGGDEKFEFITRRLRKLALTYGAGLIYTSSAGRGTNIDTLQAHILHRLYHFPLPHPSKVVGNEDDWTIHIPSGADNLDLIDSVSSVPTKSGWDDSTPLESIFGGHKRRSSTVTASVPNATPSIRALDNVLFFKNLKVQLEQGPQRRDEALRDIVHAQVKSRSSLGSALERTSSTGTNNSTVPAVSPTGTSSSSTSASAAAKAKVSSASKPKLNPKGQIAVKQFFRSLLTNNPKSDATKSAQKAVRANAEQAIASMAEGNEPEEESGNNETEETESEATS